MYKLKNIKLTNLLGSVCSIMLLALAFLAITPPVYDGASAEELQVSVAVHDYLKVALSTTALNLDVTPSIDGSFVTSDSDVTMKVETNNPTGYKLYMSTQDNQTALVNVTGDKIESIAGSKVASSDFPMNTWGYQMAIGDATSSTYDSIPSTITTLDSARKAEETYKFNFGIKVNAEKSGTYANTLVLSAVASPTELSTLTDLTYMQDMTSTICQNTIVNDDGKNPVTKQLIDIRDGKSYWVSKLKDDNCWMVQNLALDIPAEGLKAVDTDIKSDWNASSAYPPTVTETSVPERIEDGGPATATRSWDLGEYVLTNPTDATVCSNTSGTKPEGATDDGFNSVWTGGNLDNCNRLEKWNGTQDAHYLLGNYYQWNTATAGSGGEIVSGGTEGDNNSFMPNNAKDSICPKNWQLPSADSGVARSATDIASISNYAKKYGKTFTNLFTSYGFEFPSIIAPNIYGPNEQNGYNTADIPFYFSRSGNITLTIGALRRIGDTGTFWANMPATSTSGAYRLDFNSVDTLPSPFGVRWVGYSVRCVAR